VACLLGKGQGKNPDSTMKNINFFGGVVFFGGGVGGEFNERTFFFREEEKKIIKIKSWQGIGIGIGIDLVFFVSCPEQLLKSSCGLLVGLSVCCKTL
jgi:hypothetical protein